MLSDSSLVVLAVSDATRPILLIGFVFLLFGFAGLAIFLGNQRIKRSQARELSGDVGVLKGAAQGADASIDDTWLAQTRAEADAEGPRQSWADAILGPGALHDDAPELSSPDGGVVSTGNPDWEASEDAWGAAHSEDGHAAVTPMSDTDHIPAYLQPEDLTPSVRVESASPGLEPAGTVGKHAARTAPSPPAKAPFLVDNYLDDED